MHPNIIVGTFKPKTGRVSDLTDLIHLVLKTNMEKVATANLVHKGGSHEVCGHGLVHPPETPSKVSVERFPTRCET